MLPFFPSVSNFIEEHIFFTNFRHLSLLSSFTGNEEINMSRMEERHVSHHYCQYCQFHNHVENRNLTMYVCVWKKSELERIVSFISVNSRNCSQMSTGSCADTLGGPGQDSLCFEFVNISIHLSKSRQNRKTFIFAQKVGKLACKW